MKEIFFKITWLCILSCFIVSCKKPGCFAGGGSVTTVSHSLGAFSEIVLNDNINLVLTQGSTEELKVTAPENIQPNIIANIENGVLTISNTTECEWLRNPDEKITAELSFQN